MGLVGVVAYVGRMMGDGGWGMGDGRCYLVFRGGDVEMLIAGFDRGAGKESTAGYQQGSPKQQITNPVDNAAYVLIA